MIPIEWYTPTAASNPVPCAWLVWIEGTGSFMGRWITVRAFS